jgi:hypothetical protein
MSAAIVVVSVIVVLAAIVLAAFFLARGTNGIRRVLPHLGTLKSTTKESDMIKKTTTDVEEGSQGNTSEIPHAAPTSEMDEESLFYNVPINDLREADEESVGDITYGSGYTYPDAATIWSLPAAHTTNVQTEFTPNSYQTKVDEISVYSEFTRESYQTKDDEVSVYSEFTQESYWTKNDETSQVVFNINAPAGMLGMVLETPDGGVPRVQEIKSHSPLAGQVHVGDRLIAVDGKTVTSWNAAAVSRLIAAKKHNPGRELIFARQKS